MSALLYVSGAIAAADRFALRVRFGRADNGRIRPAVVGLGEARALGASVSRTEGRIA